MYDEEFDPIEDATPETGGADSGVLGVMLDAGSEAREQGRTTPARPVSTTQSAPEAAPEAWHETLRHAAEVTMNGRADL